MKRIFSGFCLFILLGNQCLLAGLNDGLVAYYPFNGNANDASGNGFDGIVYGAALATDRFGNSNACYDFTGRGEWIRVNIGPSYFAADFAISVWVNFSDFANDYPMIVSGDTYFVHCHGLGPVYANWGAYRKVTYYGGSVHDISSTETLDINRWYHLCITRQGSITSMFVNGVLSAQDTNTPVAASSGSYLQIGNDIINTGPVVSSFHGMLDDFRFYNRALSASEVQQLSSMADIGSAPIPPVLIPTNRTPTSAELGSQTSGVLKVFTNGNFVSGAALDPNKMTIVLTHGWNSSSDDWPSSMANQFVTGGISANIVAWDWRADANNDCSTTLSKTPWQGFLLGSNLLQNLGAGYSQQIHFIGHSFGTLVNAAAANYLHGEAPNNNPPQHLSPSRTQITLLDEAEIANVLGKPKVVNPTTANLGWIKPLPNSFAWADNYVSLVGELHDNTVNIILTENSPGIFYSSFTDLWNAMVFYHGEPCGWYGETILNPAGSVMGNIWSFERTNSFATPAPGTCFDQLGNGLGLEQISRQGADQLRAVETGALGEEIGVYYVLKGANAGVSFVGDVTANVIEWSLSDPNPVYQTTPATIGITTYAAATPDFWSPQLTLQNHPLNLNPNPNVKSFGVHPLDDPTPTPANSPAYAWIPMTIPTNATSLSFDFMLQGDGANDSVAAALNGTNVFSLATSFIQTNVTMNSGLIDVSTYAGQNMELFLGIVGGTSTNASLTVSGIRLYSVAAPMLQAQTAGNNCVLSWPLSAADYTLETSTDLISWTAVTNVPGIVNLQNAITNSSSDGMRFYRLQK